MTDWAKMTRGERNNNPGNIRELRADPTKWEGERSTDDDPAFEEFITPFHGIRALTRILYTYQRVYGLTTIEAIIGRWAPPVENDTRAFIESVAIRTGIPKNRPVQRHDDMFKLVKAVIFHENGRVAYSDELIEAAVKAGKP